MDLTSFAVGTLLSLSSLLGVSSNVRPVLEPHWRIIRNWESPAPNDDARGPILEVSSRRIPELCRQNPHAFVRFPSITHGAHEIYDGNRLLLSFGDPHAKGARSFYGAPSLSCNTLRETQELRWIVYSYSWYFARLSSAPSVVDSPPLHNVLGETLNIIAGGTLLLMALFSALIFHGKVSNRLAIALTLTNMAMGIYFIFCTTEKYGIHLSMLTSHRCADFSVWLGMTSFFYCLYLQQALSRERFRLYLTILAPSLLLILLGNSGDVIQLGTTLPFPLTLYLLIVCFAQFVARIPITERKLGPSCQAVGLALFVAAGFNDMLSVIGVTSQPMLLGIGVVGALLFSAIAVNDQILATYQERDYLRLHLEKEVERKTQELRTQAKTLSDSMTQLKNAQAELLQSAKLASLGTLAAGIAHEINNSINFVKGALPPVEKLGESIPEAAGREKFQKLTGVMKKGIELTVAIIEGLRLHTGLNEAKLREVKIEILVRSVLTLLKSRLRSGVTVQMDIAPHHQVLANVVGLNQVFMNLIGNALDAMADRQTSCLTLSSRDLGDEISVSIQDTGEGMNEDVRKRIFEPFFTTKDVGAGTGLGLYIVHNEIKKHQGRIEVQSEVGVGTTFTVHLPKNPTLTDALNNPAHPPAHRGVAA